MVDGMKTGIKTMIRRLYNWTLALADSPYALWALAFVAFLESSVFPIPPDIIMIPMILARPSRAFLIAGVALVASVTGALLGYYIGASLFDVVGKPMLEFYGKTDAAEQFNQRFQDWGAWAVLTAGITPFPFKVITIMSGWTGLNLGVFIISSIIARGLRFFIVAALLWKFGAPIRDFIERRLGLMFTLFVVLLLGGFYLVKYI
jgi:membrane protein YqaA with SNARE-associated domain